MKFPYFKRDFFFTKIETLPFSVSGKKHRGISNLYIYKITFDTRKNQGIGIISADVCPKTRRHCNNSNTE